MIGPKIIFKLYFILFFFSFGFLIFFLFFFLVSASLISCSIFRCFIFQNQYVFGFEMWKKVSVKVIEFYFKFKKKRGMKISRDWNFCEKWEDPDQFFLFVTKFWKNFLSFFIFLFSVLSVSPQGLIEKKKSFLHLLLFLSIISFALLLFYFFKMFPSFTL